MLVQSFATALSGPGVDVGGVTSPGIQRVVVVVVGPLVVVVVVVTIVVVVVVTTVVVVPPPARETWRAKVPEAEPKPSTNM
jgi:hypothetical protein